MKFRSSLLALTLALIAVVNPAAADPVRSVRVHFDQGTTGKSMHGNVEGRELVDYKLTARAGQMMHVQLESRHTGVYFNVYEPGKTPGKDAAFYIGATGGNTLEFRTAQDGEYIIRVFIVPSAARRGESANYVMDVRIGSVQPAAPPAPRKVADALVPGTDFHATGQLPCARHRGQPMSSCRFGVHRKGNGNGWITVFWPGDGNRVIFFEDNTPMSFDHSQADGDVRMTVGHEADLYQIRIGAERFEIPAAVMTGG